MAIILEGKISLVTFLIGSGVIVIPLISFLGVILASIVSDFLWALLLFYAVLVNGVILFVYRGKDYQVAVRGGCLGLGFGCGVILSFSDSTWSHFGWYLSALALFHWSEYFITAVTHPGSLSLDSYLLDHSREYHIAAFASWLEFTIEWYIFPGMKQIWWLSFAGALLVLFGEGVRKLAMFTARTNFNHYVQHVKEEGHQLITHGIYSKFRHPAYVGWFYWSIGTQLILCNPLCLVGYAAASWRFFQSRIMDEEISLLNFFGEDYVDYQHRVPTGLPFIRGYRMEL